MGITLIRSFGLGLHTEFRLFQGAYTSTNALVDKRCIPWEGEAPISLLELVS